MALSKITVTPTRTFCYGDVYAVIGTLSWSASPDTYAVGGNTCSFLQSKIKATRKPLWVLILGVSGYIYRYYTGTNAGDGKVVILATGPLNGPEGELSAGAIPAAVSNDQITFRAEFAGML